MPPRIVRAGEHLDVIAYRHGVAVDVSRYDEAREAAALNLKRHPELLHDDTVWHHFTAEIFVRMGGPEEIASECATEIEQGWEVSENFELFEDALPVLEELRAAELRLGLVPGFGGLAFVMNDKPRTLTLRDAQHEYLFTEAK